MKNLNFQQKTLLFGASSVVGIMEHEGPLGEYYDCFSETDLFGAKTWEQAETQMVRKTLEIGMHKCGFGAEKLDFLLGGDLLNQCTASSHGCAAFSVPFLGLYGACSTFAEGLLLGAQLLQNDALNLGGVFASSHFSTAERQYRFPLEYGCQRTPTSQRTVTGCGAAFLRKTKEDGSHLPRITKGRIGTIVDGGIKDANHMGAAMAPAAADTLVSFLKETGESPCDYDLILTGDLGQVGAKLFAELCAQRGVLLGAEFRDCGTAIFSEEQDVHAGASGCGCSAVYVCGYLEKIWKERGFRRILLLGTGALLSPLTVQQGLTIPAVAHLVCLEKE